MKKISVALSMLLIIPSVAFAAAGWSGTWSWTGEKAEVAKMEREVDSIVDDMSIFIRPIARPRLKDECQPWDTIRIRETGKQISIRTDDGELSSPLGKKVKRPSESGELTVYRRLRGDTLVETITSDAGGRTNRYRQSGSKLIVESEIFAPRLPRPVKFSYTYE